MSDSTTTTTLSLEIVGKDNIDQVDLKRIAKKSDHLKLRLFLPRQLDDKLAVDGVNLLVDEIKEFDDDDATVEHVKISNLQFNIDQVGKFLLYLSSIASSVKHLSLNKIVTGPETSIEDEQALSSLSLAFGEAQLESLNLSNNILGSYVWFNFSDQTQLQSIILEDVAIDDESFSVLSQFMSKNLSTHALSRLSLSNTSAQSESDTDAENKVLEQCTNLRSLRWINKKPKRGTARRFPHLGFVNMAEQMFRMKGHLHHLEIEGASLSDEGFSSLCEGLKVLFRLNVLKLRNLSLSKERVQMLVDALKVGRLPLQTLDLSRNPMGDDGAETLSQLLRDGFLMMNLKYLNLEYNNIGNKGGIAMLSVMGNKVNIKAIKTNGNPLQMTQVALGIATLSAQHKNESDKQIDDLTSRLEEEVKLKEQREMEDKRIEENTSRSSELVELQKQVESLTKERDTLTSAFSIMGVTNQVREQQSLLDRLSRLEATANATKSNEMTPKQKLKAALQRSAVDTPSKLTWELLAESVRKKEKLRERRKSMEYDQFPGSPSTMTSPRPSGLMLRDASQKSAVSALSSNSPSASRDHETLSKFSVEKANAPESLSLVPLEVVDKESKTENLVERRGSFTIHDFVETHSVNGTEIETSMHYEHTEMQSQDNQEIVEDITTTGVQVTSKLHASEPVLNFSSSLRSSLASDTLSSDVEDVEDDDQQDSRPSLGRHVSASTLTNKTNEEKEKVRARIRSELAQLQADAKKRMLERRRPMDRPRRNSGTVPQKAKSLNYADVRSYSSLRVEQESMDVSSGGQRQRSLSSVTMSTTYETNTPPPRRKRSQRRRGSLSNMGPLESARSDITATLDTPSDVTVLSASSRKEIRATTMASAREEIKRQRPNVQKKSSLSSMETTNHRNGPMPKLENYMMDAKLNNSATSFSSRSSTQESSKDSSPNEDPLPSPPSISSEKMERRGSIRGFFKRVSKSKEQT